MRYRKLQRKALQLGFLVLALILATPQAAEAANPKPTWHFGVSVAMEQSMADSFGGPDAAKALVSNQLQAVDSKFNTPNVFNGVFSYDLVAFSTYTCDEWAQISAPHPEAPAKLIYALDGCPRGSFGPVISWCWPAEWGGMFESGSTDGLTHEFGHFRGMIDAHAEGVQAANNPINGQAFDAPESIMTYPYGETVWDTYDVGIANAYGTNVDPSAPPVAESAFPPAMGVKVTGFLGLPVSNAKVTLYPVNWYSYSVNATPTLTGSTSFNGVFQFPSNPFGPGDLSAPWYISHPNFLVQVQANGKTAYAWLPLTTVGSAYFASPKATYTLTVPLK